jgi:hypothetical protein
MNETINFTKLQQFIANVDQEILNMQSGEGTKRPGTLHFEAGKNSAPVMNRWALFKEVPNSGHLKKFIELAKQDFGGPTGELFEGYSQAIFKVEGVVAKAVPKAFDVAVKDAFYDMFKCARIPMEPKQVERIEAISLKLAKVFEQKIATAVGFALGNTVHDQVAIQLGALVKTLKKEEVKPVKKTPRKVKDAGQATPKVLVDPVPPVEDKD